MQNREKLQYIYIISDHSKKERVKILECIKARRLDHVVVLNQQPKDKLTAYILNAKAIIVPSITEGFGYSAYEVSQLNKPVIYFDNTSLNEVVKYGHYFQNGAILHLVKLLKNSDTGEHWEKSAISIRYLTNSLGGLIFIHASNGYILLHMYLIMTISYRFMKNILFMILNKIRTSLLWLVSKPSYPDINDVEFWELYDFCKPYTMTSVERMYSLYCSVDYILTNDIEGDFVECGVWRGGSSMLIAKMLASRHISNRRLFLYDTFEGMSNPSAFDVSFTGQDADRLLKDNASNKENSVWCLADLADVKNNLKSSKFKQSSIKYIKGKVEETLPRYVPNGKIALLRLDTDWYESTKHELNTLYPLLSRNGVLIIDDYGHWGGCRKAVDDYFAQNHIKLLMNRIDYSGRLIIKNL